MEKRISKSELMELYGVDRTTIETWKRKHNLPLITISSHSKYIRVDDLLKWENKQKYIKGNSGPIISTNTCNNEDL
jgi:hypothetical protein